MATQTKTLMQAIAIDAYGGLDKLWLRELPIPEPKADEVRVRVRAAGVGIWDAMQRTGAFPPDHESFPMIVGAECSGTIDAIGVNLRGPLHVGDEVYTYFYGDGGAYAQFVCVKGDYAALKPRISRFLKRPPFRSTELPHTKRSLTDCTSRPDRPC